MEHLISYELLVATVTSCCREQALVKRSGHGFALGVIDNHNMYTQDVSKPT